MCDKRKMIVLMATILLLLAMMQESDGAKRHQVIGRFTRLVCRVYNEVIIQSLNCSLVQNGITKELMLNFDIRGTQSVSNMKLKNKFLVDRSGTITNFCDVEMDFCEALTKRFEFYIFRMLIEEINRTSNLPLKCSFRENVLYYVHNFTITLKYLPQFLPNMEWSSYLNFTVNDSNLFGMDVFGSVMRKKI